MTLRTFAYGMNMDPRTMHGWAENGQAAKLHDYRLDIHHLADVVPSPGDTVLGVVWDIVGHGLNALDRRESYPFMYGRETVTVELADGTLVDAIVYRMTDRTKSQYSDAAYGEISFHYHDMLVTGRETFGMPTDDIPDPPPPNDDMVGYLKALRAGPDFRDSRRPRAGNARETVLAVDAADTTDERPKSLVGRTLYGSRKWLSRQSKSASRSTR